VFGDISATAASVAQPPKLLLARDVQALQQLPVLAPFYRVYSWVSPLSVNQLHTWDIARVLARESRAQTRLSADPAFRLGGPDAALLDAQRRGTVAARRLLLVGGETSALLLGFAIIAAIGLGRGLKRERLRLLAHGARRWQVALVSCSEIAAITFAGAVVGLGVGIVIAASIARTAQLPAGAIVSHAIATKTALAALVVGWLATTMVLLLTTLVRDARVGRRVRPIDVAAGGAVVTIAIALSRGALDPSSAASGDTALFLILPALVCFVAAVVVARLLAPAMRAAERLTRRRSISLRLAVLALARAPARTVVSAAFVTIALGLALFAGSYRATLVRGAADQAAFEVPLDFTATEGTRLVRPLEAAPLARYRRLGGDASAYPVLRLAATTPGNGATVLAPTVLGIPAAALAKMHWRSDFSSLPLRTIAARLAQGGQPRLARIALPVKTRRVTIAARLRGSDVDVGLVVDDRRGRVSVLRLGALHEGAATLSAAIDASAHPHVLGLQLTLPVTEQFFLAHRETEGRVATAPAGLLELGPLVARQARSQSRIVSTWDNWSLRSGGGVADMANRARLPFVFQDTGGRLVFRPAEPTDGKLMPVLVSPEIARVEGMGAEMSIDFQDIAVRARIVGVANRLPTIPSASGPFVLADSHWLSTALDAGAPGRGTPSEVWISAADNDAAALALHRRPFASLVVKSRAVIERRLETDPLAHATAEALGAAAVVALGLALLGFWVGIASELRDERSDFFDLEAQGLPPGRLRAQLRTRAGILVAIGLAGGAALGALLSQAVVSLVRISATTGVPEPPLRLEPAWFSSGLTILALATLALVIAEVSSLTAFRQARPERASWSLE
jgi:hypothetical protein